MENATLQVRSVGHRIEGLRHTSVARHTVAAAIRRKTGQSGRPCYPPHGFAEDLPVSGAAAAGKNCAGWRLNLRLHLSEQK